MLCAAFNKSDVFLSKHRQVHEEPSELWSNLFNIVTGEETFLSSNPARPPAWRICRENKHRVKQCGTFQIYHINPITSEPPDYFLWCLFTLCLSLFFSHTPSLTRSKTSLTSKLISSVSWPTYWYNARQRGPCCFGCGLGAGGGRWLMLLFLCFLWQRERETIKGWEEQ